ncbi:rRNA large subunit methyltransferase [Nitritalea halalkaliphila LW7]|uniref:Ribosomal RNA large subunit methyltransferase H n=2 Tax=Nitritalea TaxID=1187887 RepID=I5BWS6_9BACT|nr:rRNA large subunit methyltransferase [Nitritalea halalkaliphila LW7]
MPFRKAKESYEKQADSRNFKAPKPDSMQIKIIAIGKTDERELEALYAKYLKRLQFYLKVELEVIPDIKGAKNLSESSQKEKEAVLFLKRIQDSDRVYLLDEGGKLFTSKEFSEFWQKQMNAGWKQVILLIGGPYGFDSTIYDRADGTLSLSKMTFSHQMVRLFLLEQVYRAYTILNGEPYHHE